MIRSPLSLLALLIAIVPATIAAQDVLVYGGTVVDGSGDPARKADVLIADGRVVRVELLTDAERDALEVTTRIDAEGHVVAPGFIDMHAHGDPLRTPAFGNFIAMGVTTVCLGLDGSSPTRRDLSAWIQQVSSRRPAPNIVPVVGHGTVRRAAGVGTTINPTPEQVEAMVKLVTAALESGAHGLSTGLEYEPGRFADLDELVAVARPVGARGGFVMSHLRSEDDDQLDGALEELIEQCRRASAAAHVSHLKIVYGNGIERAESVLSLLNAARDSGIRVTADVYPYAASYTGLGILFPDWARPPHDYQNVVSDRREELEEYLRNRVTRRNGPGATVFGTGEFAGKSLEEVAHEQGTSFEEVLIGLGPGGASAAYFVMDRAVMERFLVDPFVAVASDGSPTMRHPRGHGTFARVIQRYVVEEALLSLEEAVRKMTSLPASILGLSHRGTLAPGKAADLIVFAPEAVEDRATFANPYQRAAGFRTVLVNGTPVVMDGKPTSERPGRVLRRG